MSLNFITSSLNPFNSNALLPSELAVLSDEEVSLVAAGDSSLRGFLRGGSSTPLSAAVVQVLPQRPEGADRSTRPARLVLLPHLSLPPYGALLPTLTRSKKPWLNKHRS